MIEIKDIKDKDSTDVKIDNYKKKLKKELTDDKYLNDIIDELVKDKSKTKYTLKNFLEDTCYIWSIIGLITACINIYHCIKWLKENFEEY